MRFPSLICGARPLRLPPTTCKRTGCARRPAHRHRQHLTAVRSPPSLMDYYSFNRPRMDGWLSWPCWLTDSGRFTHKVVTRPAFSLAQDRESSPARTGGLTTMLRHQLRLPICLLMTPFSIVNVESIPRAAASTSRNCCQHY